MRAQMLERRINKEKKRKAEEAERMQEKLRNISIEGAQNLDPELKQKIESMGSMGLMQPKSETVLFTDQLYAKIKAWENGVREVKELRGGEEGNIWNLQYVKEKEDEEKAR